MGPGLPGGRSAASMMFCWQMPKRVSWPLSSAVIAVECRGPFMRRRSELAFAKRRPPYISNNTRAGNLFMKRFGLVTTLALCVGSAVTLAQTPAPAVGPVLAPPAAAPAAPAAEAAAQEASAADFAVSNIRIEGLQRI